MKRAREEQDEMPGKYARIHYSDDAAIDIQCIPSEIMTVIFFLLSAQDLLRLRSVDTYLNKLTYSNVLWQGNYNSDFGSVPEAIPASWEELYRVNHVQYTEKKFSLDRVEWAIRKNHLPVVRRLIEDNKFSPTVNPYSDVAPPIQLAASHGNVYFLPSSFMSRIAQWSGCY